MKTTSIARYSFIMSNSNYTLKFTQRMFRYCNYWNNIILLEEINPNVNYMLLGFDWMVFFFLTSWFCKINASKISVIIKLLLGCQKQCISFANLYMHSLPIKFINAEFTISFCISIFLDIWHRTCTKYALYINPWCNIYLHVYLLYSCLYTQ